MDKISVYITGIDLAKDKSGVGPNSWGYWRMLIPCQSVFSLPASNHDAAYSAGLTELDRYSADTMFRSQCLERSQSKIDRMFAGLYYKFVRKFGKSYFNYKQDGL